MRIPPRYLRIHRTHRTPLGRASDEDVARWSMVFSRSWARHAAARAIRRRADSEYEAIPTGIAWTQRPGACAQLTGVARVGQLAGRDTRGALCCETIGAGGLSRPAYYSLDGLRKDASSQAQRGTLERGRCRRHVRRRCPAWAVTGGRYRRHDPAARSEAGPSRRAPKFLRPSRGQWSGGPTAHGWAFASMARQWPGRDAGAQSRGAIARPTSRLTTGCTCRRPRRARGSVKRSSRGRRT